MRKIISVTVLIAALFFILVSAKFKGEDSKKRAVKNVIVLIGDGMGISQMSSAYYYQEATPNFSRFPFVGLSRTSASSHKITDSAAGATAISAGKKTYNGAIGVDPDTNAVETLLEYFHQQGHCTALISTSSITHATPASFYAHVDSRRKAFEIASQMASSGTDFFAGGGREYFRRKEVLKALQDGGYNIDTNQLQAASELDPKRKYGYLLANDGMPRMTEGRGSFLKDATELALSYLQKKAKPFFMMVEGSQIDWGGHANEAEYVITETLDFDKVVGAVLDFAEKDGNTLVIVTADHETGGFTLSSEIKEVPFQGKQSDYNSIVPTFSTGGHSAAMVPVLAYGPGAGNFAGIYENTEIHNRIMKLLKKAR